MNVFGFRINLPVVSYDEIGTQFTANHAHGYWHAREPEFTHRHPISSPATRHTNSWAAIRHAFTME